MADKSSKYAYMTNNNENKMLLQNQDKCDKYDYLAAVVCGAIGGLMDIFFVGAPKPNESVLQKWTDQQVDNAVIGFARKMGWNPKEKNINNVNSAIGYLEHGRNTGNINDFQGFKVNYDQRKPEDVNNLFNISPSTHHMMSLAHSPDVVGLFFSILNQFTSTSTFIANGQVVTIETSTFELRGSNFVMKIMCGIANWFGHLMSDIAGSSGKHNRGVGIVMPFYELFGLFKFGNFSIPINEEKSKYIRKDLSEIAMQAFTEGYDFRFGLAQAIPVVVTELSIRLIWALRQRFQYHKPVKECIPTMKHADLRVMLLFGNGTLCFMDGIDASVRSGGNFLNFFMRLNLVAWFRLVTLVFKEVCIRVGIIDSLQMKLEAFKRINEALLGYLRELEKIDIDLFKKETEDYRKSIGIFELAKTEKDLTVMLLNTYEELGIKKPWKGDFDEHMANKNGTLVFE